MYYMKYPLEFIWNSAERYEWHPVFLAGWRSNFCNSDKGSSTCTRKIISVCWWNHPLPHCQMKNVKWIPSLAWKPLNDGLPWEPSYFLLLYQTDLQLSADLKTELRKQSSYPELIVQSVCKTFLSWGPHQGLNSIPLHKTPVASSRWGQCFLIGNKKCSITICLCTIPTSSHGNVACRMRVRNEY